MRLNKIIREAITQNALIKAGVIAREESIMDNTAALAESVRVFYYGGKKKLEASLAKYEQLKALEKEIPNFLYRDSSLLRQPLIEANFAGMRIDLRFDGDVPGISSTRATVYKTPCTYNRVDIPQGHKLVDKFTKLEAEKKEVKGLRESITLQVNATTKSISTVEKLLKVWPEAKELLPEKELQAASMPVVQTKALNSLIGLPS